MTFFTENDQDVIIGYMSDAATYLETEKNLKAVAARLFTDAFGEDWAGDAEDITEAIYTTVKNFDNDLLHNNADRTLRACLRKLADEKEKKSFVSAALEALADSELASVESADNFENLEALSDKLCDATFKIAGECIDLEKTENAYRNTSRSCILSEDSVENKTLYAMAFYCAAKRDELSGVPNEITPEQCALIVCAGCELNLDFEISAHYENMKRKNRQNRIAAAIIMVMFFTFFSPVIYITAVVKALMVCFNSIVFSKELLEVDNVFETLEELLTPNRVFENDLEDSEETQEAFVEENVQQDINHYGI